MERSFCEILEEQHGEKRLLASKEDVEAFVETIAESVIGEHVAVDTPFGERPIVYGDWVASGRALAFIEDEIRDQVLPLYANTHTTTSATGLQSTSFRHEARQIISESVNANVTQDVVLFTGTGCTGAVAKFVEILGLRTMQPAREEDRPVVFHGPFEHHSNMLPWRESCAEVVTIPADATGRVDRAALAAALERYAARPLRIGSFSAASNITGVLEDVDALAIQLHRAGALACFDYACAGPYARIDMNPAGDDATRPFAHKDAVFISPHKFVGGPGAPGVLVAKKRLLSNRVPSNPGGGTVFFVSEHAHRYLSNKEEREEGGTPDIVGAVRCGLAFQVKDSVGAAEIAAREEAMVRGPLARLAAHPNVCVLGPPEPTPRLPIASFLLRVPGAGAVARRSAAGHRGELHRGDDLFLHPNAVSALLNDVFGVQVRAGCMCAGPYAQALLGLSAEDTAAIEAQLLERKELLRPGVTRVAFPYFMPRDTADYIVDAIIWVAEHGWKLLPQYRFNPLTGEWRHTTRFTKFPGRRWLGHISFDPATRRIAHKLAPRLPFLSRTASRAERYAAVHAAVAPLAATAAADGAKLAAGDQATMLGDGGLRVRWFMFPSEAAAGLRRAAQGAPAFPMDDAEGGGVRSGPVAPVTYRPTAPPAAAPATAAVTAVTAVTAARQELAVYGGEPATPVPAPHDDAAPSAAAEAAAHHIGPAAVVEAIEVAVAAHTEVPATGAPPACVPDADGVCIPCIQPRARSKVAEADSAARTPVGPGAAAFEIKLPPATAEQVASDRLADDADGVRRGGAAHLTEKFPARATGGAAAVAAEAAVRLEGAREAAAQTTRLSEAARLRPKVPAEIVKLTMKAIAQWEMIRPGDRVLLGLSGGKDSLALLHVLLHLKRKSLIEFDVAAATVDPGTEAFDPSPLIPYLRELGVEYHYLRDDIFSRAEAYDPTSICSYCARFKRGALYSCCRANGYNVLMLAQHLDDLAETFLMSAFHNGVAASMRAHYVIGKGDIRVARPFVYVREYLLKEFSYSAKLPVINENCPACFEAPKERARVKALLAQEESYFPIFNSLQSALTPLMAQEVHHMHAHVTNVLKANSERHRHLRPSRDQRGKLRSFDDLRAAEERAEEYVARTARFRAVHHARNRAEVQRRAEAIAAGASHEEAGRVAGSRRNLSRAERRRQMEEEAAAIEAGGEPAGGAADVDEALLGAMDAARPSGKKKANRKQRARQRAGRAEHPRGLVLGGGDASDLEAIVLGRAEAGPARLSMELDRLRIALSSAQLQTLGDAADAEARPGADEDAGTGRGASAPATEANNQ